MNNTIQFKHGYLPNAGFLRLSQVLEFIPVSRATWFNGVKAGKFPKPVNLGKRTIAYRVEDIKELIEKISTNGGL